MTTLQGARDRVRTQADLDEEDLPDEVLDAFIREGFDRTFSAEHRWPFFEHQWSLTKADGESTIDMPTSPAVGALLRLRETGRRRLIHLAHRVAEDELGLDASGGVPEFFSLWGDKIYLWPASTEGERTFTAVGYRKPTWTGVAEDELDGDERLHSSIIHYAQSLAYDQLEDPEASDSYMRRWGSGLDQVRRNIMRPVLDEPLILNGGSVAAARRRSGYPVAGWNL